MHFDLHPPMTRRIVPWRAAPPWRTLGTLAVLVLLAHALVLQMHPARIGPAPAPATQRPPAFTTRSIPLPPPAALSAPRAVAAPSAQAAVTPVKKPVFKQKEALAQAAPASPAINSIANSPPEPPAADTSTALAEADSPPAPATPPATAGIDTATAAAVPASAAPAPPPPPPAPSQTLVTAMALPASAQLDYKMTGSVKGLPYYAKGELAWQNAGSSYDVRMTVSALFIGSRTMTSTGHLNAKGLLPTRFSDKSRSELAAHFEPDKGQISFSSNTPAISWNQGVQDRVSVFMQLGGMLAGNPAGFPVGSSISMITVGPRDADNWTFLVEREEKLSLPFGDVATLKLSRQPRRDYDQKVEVWYAPALDYLPVRNKITQASGDFVDQQLSALTRP